MCQIHGKHDDFLSAMFRKCDKVNNWHLEDRLIHLVVSLFPQLRIEIKFTKYSLARGKKHSWYNNRKLLTS